MNDELKIIREVSAEAELFYDEAKKLGEHAAHALKKGHRSQMTGLENIAQSALKTSDIFDYIKKQTARFPDWRQALPGKTKLEDAFGECLRTQLEDKLRAKRDTICERLQISNTSYKDQQERRRIYLLLMRQFIRQMVVHYEYRINWGEKTNHASHS